jgi:hypothetical protein
MPQLPTFDAPLAPNPAEAPRANPQAFAEAGAGIAAGAARVEDVAGEFAQRYADAKRQMMATTAIAGASAKMGELEQSYSLMPDRDAAYAGFQKDAGKVMQATVDGIDDPLVKAHVQDQLQGQYISRGLATRGAAFQMESSKYRGQLDQIHAQYVQDAAMASSPQQRALTTDQYNAAVAGAAAAGWLHPEEVAQRRIQFNIDVGKADALGYMRTAAEAAAQGRLSPLAIGDALSDPANAPGMTAMQRASIAALPPVEREQLALQGIARGKIIVQMKVGAQAHDDAMAEKDLKRVQGANEISILDAIDKGQAPDAATLLQLGKTQQISPAGFELVRTQIAKRDAGTNDLPTLGTIYQRLGSGADVSGDVLDAARAGTLSRTTASELLKANVARGEQGESAIDKANFATLKTALGIAPEGGIISFANEAKERTNARLALSTEAQGEWTRRVRIGREDSGAVIRDMLQRYRLPDAPSVFPTPLGAVTSEDEGKALWLRAQSLHAAGTLSDSAYQQTIDALGRAKAVYAEKAASDAARATALKGGATNTGPKAQPALGSE